MDDKIFELKSFIKKNTSLQNIYDYLGTDNLPIFYRWPHLETLLFWVCKSNNLELAKICLENGADINTENMYGCTPLYYAISECRSKFISQKKYTKNIVLIDFLINNGANIYCTSVFSGYDLFYLASGMPEIFRLLIDKKLKIESVKNYKKILANIEKERNEYEHFWRYKWKIDNELSKSKVGLSGNIIPDEIFIQKINLVICLENSLFK